MEKVRYIKADEDVMTFYKTKQKGKKRKGSYKSEKITKSRR